MKIYRFDTNSGKEVTHFNSVNFHAAHIVVPAAVTHVARLHLGAGGIIGYHQAAQNQLFMADSD
jgi:hypothetical protein